MPKVSEVWAAEIDGVKCLESKTQIGFFKNASDHRPSSCRWVKKNKVKPTRQETLI